MSIYFFVFEMQAVRIQLEQLATFETLKQTNLKIRNFVMSITLLYGICYSTIRTVFSVDRQFVSTTEEVAYVITFTTKLFLDFYVIVLFSTVFSFFFQRRKQALSREALRMTPLNQLVLVTIFFLYFMRVAGSLYTFIVGILVLIPSVFNSPAQMLSYVILDDLVFPLRDFIETIMFSYMFYYQSNKRKNLAKINEKWHRNTKGSVASQNDVTRGKSNSIIEVVQ